MGLPLLFAFQEPWVHFSELQLPPSHPLTLLSPIAILVFSLVPAALPELSPCTLQGLWLVACPVQLGSHSLYGIIAPVSCSKRGASLPTV